VSSEARHAVAKSGSVRAAGISRQVTGILLRLLMSSLQVAGARAGSARLQYLVGALVYTGILYLVGFALRPAAAVVNSSGNTRSRPEGLSESPECARVRRCFWGYLCLLNRRGCCLSSTVKSFLSRVALRGLQTLLGTPKTSPMTYLDH
jgi:hypothetical protein